MIIRPGHLVFLLCLLASPLIFSKDLHQHESHGHESLDEDDGHDHDNLEGAHESLDDNHKDHEDKGGHDHAHEHGSAKAIGVGKAILLVDEVKGFRLSKEAEKTLGIKLKSIYKTKIKITKETLVSSKDKKGVYLFRDGYYKFITAKIIKEERKHYRISILKIVSGDKIVIKGVGLLRVTDIYSTDKSEYGHSH